MRVPGLQYRGVRRLGRFSVGAPLAEANAEAQAVGQMGRALGVAGAALDSYYRANAAAEYDKAMAELRSREAELRGLIMSGPTLDSRSVPLPDWLETEREEQVVQPDGTTAPQEKRFYQMHAVGLSMYEGTMRRLTESALETTSNPLARAQLQAKAPLITAAHLPQVQAKVRKYARDRDIALVEVALEDSVRAAAHGDPEAERQAFLALDRAFSVGLITPGDYSRRRVELGGKIDQARYQTMMMSADTPEEIEQVQEYIADGVLPTVMVDPETGQQTVVFRRSRLDPDGQWAMRSRSATMANEAERARTREQEENMGELVRGAIAGQVGSRDIMQALEDDRISHGQALTLESYNRARRAEARALAAAGRESEAERKLRRREAEDPYRRGIVTMGMLTDAETVSAKADMLRKNIEAATLGMDPTTGAPYQGPRLEGDQAQKLLRDIDARQKSFTTRPAVKRALIAIDSATAYRPFAPDLEESNVRARLDFRRELFLHVDEAGEEADPEAFVTRHAERFNPDNYAGASVTNFINLYPDLTESLTGDNVGAAKEGVARGRITLSDPAAAREDIQYGILEKLHRGEISEEEARILQTQVTGGLPERGEQSRPVVQYREQLEAEELERERELRRQMENASGTVRGRVVRPAR